MAQPSPKLQSLLKEFQQIASMAGYLNHSFDAPQLRLFFTLYGRLIVPSPEAGLAITPRLQAWSEAIAVRLREGSSSAILPPQVQVSAPQALPDGRHYLVATLTFTSKVTESSYLRVRTAVLAAYQAAILLRDQGLEAAEAKLAEAHIAEAHLAEANLAEAHLAEANLADSPAAEGTIPESPAEA